MKKISKVGGIIAIVGLVSLLAAIASITGGISIRALPQQPRSLSMTTPILPGVPFAVNLGEGVASPSLTVRSSGYEQVLPVQLQEGAIVTSLPCDISAGEYQFVLVNGETGAVHASTVAQVLPPGPDCF